MKTLILVLAGLTLLLAQRAPAEQTVLRLDSPRHDYSGPGRATLGNGNNFGQPVGQVTKRRTLNLVMAGSGTIGLPNAAMTAPTTEPGVGAIDRDLPASKPLGNLPPEALLQVREQIGQLIPKAMHDRDTAEADLADAQRKYGTDHPVVVERRAKLLTVQQRLGTLLNALEQLADRPPDPTIPVQTPWTGLPWVDRHFAAIFLGLTGFCLATAFPLQLLIRRGRGGGLVLGLFGLMLAVGLAELFAAGVAMGLGRPLAAWATLLGYAAVAIVIPALQLPQVRRAYADRELRKMRAIDVG